MKGMDKTDSICWDPHKMLGSILQCALIVTKHVSSHVVVIVIMRMNFLSLCG